MMPLREIRVKNSSLIHDTNIVPADSVKSTFKQDLLQMKAEVVNSFESHCFNKLSKFEAGRKSSLMFPL